MPTTTMTTRCRRKNLIGSPSYRNSSEARRRTLFRKRPGSAGAPARGHLAQILRRGAPEADEVVAGRRAASMVGQPPGHAERRARVVVARAANDDTPGSRVGLAAVVAPIGIGTVRGRGPLRQIAVHVFALVG